MLVKFICENFMSFKNEIVLDMAASSSMSQHKNHIIQDTPGKKVSFLRASAIYGANASGKSNLIKAIHFAKKFILSRTELDQSIQVTPFKLSRKSQNNPSRFEFLVKHKGLLYHYGFVVNRQKVIEEWLYVTKKQEVKWFERTTDGRNKVSVDIGSALANKGSKKRQRLEFIGEGMLPNQLYFNKAVNNNVEELIPLFRWFQNVLQIITPSDEYPTLAVRAARDKDFTNKLATILKLADVGIDGIEIKREKLDFDSHFPFISEETRKDILGKVKHGDVVNIKGPFGTFIIQEEKGELIVLKLFTQHQLSSDENGRILFELEEESDGTLRLMNLAPVLIDLTNEENVFVIDELARSLHPMLTRFFVDYFLNSTLPDSRSQMIFTTHDTHVLDLDLLRRDEIWFLEKDEKESSTLYSLSDFKPRKDLKIEKGYLQGRFGALPFIGDPSQLGLEPKQ